MSCDGFLAYGFLRIFGFVGFSGFSFRLSFAFVCCGDFGLLVVAWVGLMNFAFSCFLDLMMGLWLWLIATLGDLG